ncbi:MAG TPA: hypothetical protein VF680_10250 [Allosphingosinicella sp.]|jgi:hypothetical protein
MLPRASCAVVVPPIVASWFKPLAVEAVVPEPWPAQANRSLERLFDTIWLAGL